MTTTHPSVTQGLARWASDLQSTGIPAAIRARAKTSLIDTIGVSIAGSQTRVGRIARAVGLQAGSHGWSTLFSSAAHVSEQTAAFVNSVSAHALDFDDNCYAGVVHGSAVIVPAALAMGQKVNATGGELITAFVAGSECEYAIGAASRNVLYEQGWWTTGVLGPIGSCVAASHLLKLDPEKITSALGLAITGAGGTKACFGTDGKALMAGRAAEAGVVCALLAAQGARGPVDAIESTNGFVKLFNEGVFDPAAIDRLGSHWFSQEPGVDIKRIPVCLSSHAAVDAVMHLVATHRIRLDEIESIVCDVPPMVSRNLVYTHPETVQESQFSMQYAMAVSLKFGTLTLEHLDQKLLKNNELASLMARVHMRTGPLWDDAKLRQSAPEGAEVQLRLSSGKVFQLFRATARGSVGSPLSSQEIGDKFIACAAPAIGNGPAETLLSRLRTLDGDVFVRDLFESETPT
ncbi:MmgE/PrpD family protein [Polaromonas jejuensis]|uniref:MmgE/PrpD family protein n=1 Tax=Polaromonas jejuensis TaxID=457502 RepID=A0ABW0Q6E6_9BURK|nr:MmgE/PrpD family protein [Polaromonas jejuensis]